MDTALRKVEKEWGHELWIKVDNNYVIKKLFIKKGHRPSWQYHKEKEETMMLLSGEATLLIQYFPTKVILNKEMNFGELFTIRPLDRHRVVAHEDTWILEISTNHLDDLVRLEDDYGRI